MRECLVDKAVLRIEDYKINEQNAKRPSHTKNE